MAFSSSRLAIEQVTFEADDQRCNQQNVSSLQDLVNFDCEFPQQESLSFYKLFKKRETYQSGLNEDSENIQNFDDSILESELSRSNIDESFKNHVSIEISKNLIQPMLKESNNNNNLDEDKVINFFKMNSTTNESVLNDSSKNIDQPSIDIEKVLKHAEEILRNAHIDELTYHSPQPSNSSKAHQTKESTPHSKTQKKQISWLSRTNSQTSLVTNDEHSDKIGYAYSNTSYLNSEISRLREENELLIIKINKLKYEIRSKDQVADDLKQKIAQMHIELESTSLSKTQFLTDIESLRNDLNRLNGEKSGLYENMKELLNENDQLQVKLKLEYKRNNEQASLIDRLQKENDALRKESIDVKMRCLKEKEDLVRNLEQIETDIIRREQNMFTQKYEKILIESCEAIKINEAKKYKDMLKQEAENIRKDFETKLNDFKNTSENTNKIIQEYSNQEKMEKNLILDLEKFQDENKILENKLNQYEVEIEYLKKYLQVELEKSDAKSNEIISINRQKFKLMAQVKQAVKEKEENEILKKEILNLKNKLCKNEDKNNKIQIKNEKEINPQIDQRKDYDDEIIELKQKNEKLENELNILDTLKLQSECDIITLRNEIDSKDEEIAKLNDEIQKIRTILQMTESSQNLEDQKFSLGEKMKQFEQDILNQQEINEKLNLNLVEWNNANQILEQEILNNQQLNQNLNERLASDQINISSLQQCYENLKIDENEASKKINELETKRLELKLKIESLEAEIIEFQELNTQLVDNLQQWQQANKILEDQIEAQQQNSNFLNQSNELIEKNKQDEEKSLFQEFTKKSECENHQNEDLNLMNIEEKIESLIDQNTQTVHDSSDDLENSMITTKCKLDETENSIKLIESEIIRNQELYSNLMENLAEWENANRVLEKQIIDLQTQNNELVLSHQSFEPKLLFDEAISKLKQEYEELLNSKEMRIEDLLFKLSKLEENSVSNVTNDLKRNSNLIDQVSAKDNLDYTLNSENTDEICAPIIDSVALVKNEDDKTKSPSDEKQKILNEEQKNELFDQLESKNRLIEELNKAIDQYSNLSKMPKRIEDLETCKFNLENKINDLENEIKIIQYKIFENEELNEQLKNNLTEWNNANETLEAKILECQSENMGLSLKLDDQIAKHNEDIINNISDKYNKEIEELKKKIDRQQQIDEEINLLKEVVELKDQKLNDLNEMLEQYRAKDNLVDNINALEQKKSELDSQVLNIEQEISNLEASILEKQNLSSQLSQNLIEWQNSNQLLEDQIISLQQQNSQLLNEQSLETINQQNLDKINSLERINQELLESNEKYMEEIAILKVREQEMKCKIDESEKTRQELQIQNMDLLCNVDSLRSEKYFLENELKELAVNDPSNLELTNTIKNDSYCSQDSAKVEDLEAIIDDLKKEMSKKDEQFQISIKELELEIEHRQNEYNLLISNFESLQSSDQQLQNKNTDLLGQIDALKLQNQSLQTDLIGLKEMENRCNDLIENVQDLNSQVLLKDQELFQLRNISLLAHFDQNTVEKENFDFKNHPFSKPNIENIFNEKDTEEEEQKMAKKKMEEEIGIMKETIGHLKKQNQILESIVDRQKILSNKENIVFNEEIKIRGKIDQLKTKLIYKLENEEQYSEQILTLKNEIKELYDQNRILKEKKEINPQIDQRKDYDDEIIELKQKNEKLENELNILDTLKLQSECDIITLRNEIDSKDEEIAKLNDEIQKIRTILQMTESSQNLEDQKFSLGEKMKQFEQDILNQQEINEKLNLNLVEWNNANQILEQEILNNQQLNQNLNERLASDQINISSLQQCYENLKIDENEASKKINELETKRLELKLKIESLEAEIIEFQELNTQLVDNLQQWQQANKILEDQIEAQQQNSNFLNQSNELIEKNKQDEEKSLFQEFTKKSECENHQNEDLNLMNIEEKIESLIDQNTQTVHDSSDDLENSMITTKCKLDETENSIKLIESEIIRNQELYSNLMENLAEWENANRVLEKQIIDLQTQNNELVLSHQSFEPKLLFDEAISKLKQEYEELLNSKEMRIEDLLFKLSKLEENSVSNVTNDLKRNSNLIDQVSAKDNLDYTLNSENTDEICAPIIDSVALVKNEDDKTKSPSDEKQKILNEEQKNELFDQLESKNRLIEELNKAIDQYSNLSKMPKRIEDLETCKFNLENKINDLENEIKIIQYKIFENEELNEQLKNNLTEWNNANETLEAKILECQSENMGLSLKLDDQIAKHNEDIINNISDKYNKEIEELKKKIDRQQQIDEEINLLKEVVELKDQKLNDLNEMLEQYRAKDNLVDNINALEQKKSELDSQVLNIEQEISNLEASILEKQNLSSQLSQNLIEWQNSNQLLEDQIISLQQLNSQLLNEQSRETINQQNLDKINSLERINQELMESNEKYIAEIHNLNNLNTSNTGKELFENKIIDLEREIQFYKNERDNCLVSISRLDEELKSLRTQNSYLISETEKNYIKANICDEINCKTFKILDSENSNSILIQTTSDEEFFHLELKYKDLFSQNEILKSEKNELCHKINQFENDLNLLSTQIEQDFDLNKSSSNDINELMDQVTNLKDDNFRLLKENESQILENDELSKKLELLNAELVLKDQQKFNLEMKEISLMNEIDELNISLDKMSSRFYDKKIELEALQNKILEERDCVNEEKKNLITKNELLQKEIEQQAKDLIKFKKIIKKLKKDYNDCIEAKKDLEDDKFNRREEQSVQEKFVKNLNTKKNPEEKKIEIKNLKSSEIERDLSILNGTKSEDRDFKCESNKSENPIITEVKVQKTSELFKVKNNEKDELNDHSQIDHLKDQFNLKNEEIDLLKEVVELKDQKLNELNEMLEQYRSKDNLVDNINALEQRKSELDFQVLNIEQEISNLEASILEKQNLSSQLSQNLIEWQNSNQSLEDQIISLQQQNSQLLNEQSLETINQQNLDKINSLERINQELLESNEKYMEEIAILKVREQEMRCKIDESEKTRQELQIQNMDLLCDVDSLRSEKDVLENERKELAVNDSSNSELTNTIKNDSYCSQDSAKVEDLEAIIDDLKKEMSKKDEQFQISIKELELEIEHRQNEYNLLISNFESLQSSDQQLQNKNTDLLGQIDALKLQNQSLQTNLTGLKEMENRCNDLIENVQDLNSQVLLKDQELINVKDQNSHLLSELDSLKVKKEEIEFLYNKSVSDHCKLHDLNTEIDILKSQLESKNLDITEFKNKINFADQQHEKMIRFFENKISDLNAKIDSKDDLINILQSEINTLKPNEEFNKTGNITLGENISSSDPDIEIYILNNIVQNQKLLIDKLEKESKKMCFLYEKLIYAQSRLISKQGQCYNDALHSLINSFQDLDPNQIDHKVQEIESDLNNLIHVLNNIKDNDLENAPSDTLGSPYSPQSLRQFISQHSSPVKVSDSVNSLTDEFEINSHQDGTFQEENLKHKNATSLLLMVKKCDAETQCDMKYYKDDHTGTLRLSTDFNEINNLQDLIANYLNLIKGYKSLLAKLDAVSVDNSELREAYSFLNDEFLKFKKSNSKNQISKEVNGHRTSDLSENEKIHNLKSAYENLYSLYQQHKTESIKSYNKLHNAYIQLINSSKNNFYPQNDYLQAQPTIAHNAPKVALQNQELSCSASVNLKSEIDKLDSRLQAEELKNQVLKQKLNDYEIQIELSNSKINALGGQIELKENEFRALKSKIDQIETAKDNTINKLTKNSNSLAEECELLKSQLSSLNREKIDLESTVEDLKRTLKLTEKESQYNLKLDLMHIRAKLLTPSNEELAIGADGKPLRAILPPVSETSSIKSSSSLNSIDKSDILNDYAIDITHIEKMVQDSDSIILEKKPLDGVQSCLKSLRDQMTELQTQVYEQARESSTWRYKLGFTCEKCEMKWEIEHQVRDSKQKLDGDDEFLDCSVTQQIPKCNCAKLNEKHEADLN